MEVAEKGVLHMNGGEGPTSYAQNCSFQRKILQMAMPAVEAAVLELYGAGDAASPDQLISVADLGCSSGPNALAVVAGVVDAVEERCMQLGRSPPEFQLFLNDLPGNDFNSVFISVEAFYGERERGSCREGRRCFIAGVAESFYGRLFPSRSIHFFHSSSSLHWLSQAPPELQEGGMSLNKRNAYFTKASPPFVVDAYTMQFQRDFSDFLRFRSEEMVIGGRMVLLLFGRKDSDPAGEEVTSHWALLTQVLMDMVQQGYITEEKVDTFNLPYYEPCAMEAAGVIRRDGSFSIKCLETLEVVWDNGPDQEDQNDHDNIKHDTATGHTNTMRAVLEPMLAGHFGGDIIEDLFIRYGKVLDQEYCSSVEEKKVPIILISLLKEHQLARAPLD